MKSDGSGLEISSSVSVFCVACGMIVSHGEKFRNLHWKACVRACVCECVRMHMHTCRK